MQAETLHSILESNGIYSLVSGMVYPPIGFEVKVRRADFQKAQRMIKDAQASGPKAAEEAEAASEGKE